VQLTIRNKNSTSRLSEVYTPPSSRLSEALTPLSYRLSEAHGEKFFRKFFTKYVHVFIPPGCHEKVFHKLFSRQPSGMRVSITDDTHKSTQSTRDVSIEVRDKVNE